MSKLYRLVSLFICLQFFQIWALGQKSQRAELYVETGNSDDIRSISISPDGKFLISGGNDETVKLWDLTTQRELKTFSDEYTFSTIIFLSDNKTFVTGDTGGNVVFWDVPTGTEIKKVKLTNDRPLNLVVVSSDDKWLAAIEDNSPIVRLLNISTGEKYEVSGDLAGYATSVAFSPDGKTFAVTGRYGSVNLFDTETRKKTRSFLGHKTLSWTVAFSPDGKTLSSGDWNNTIKLWDVKSGEEIHSLTTQANILSVKFSPDGKTLISADGSLILWDVETGNKLKTFGNDENDSSETVIFSPDGTEIIVADGKIIRFWDVKNGMEVNKLQGLTEDVATPFITFSPDGKLLALPTGKAINLWDTASWQRKEILTDDNAVDFGKSVFSSDSKLLVTDADNKIILFDVSKGKKIRTFTGHAGNVYTIAFSPDNKQLVSADIGGLNQNGVIKIWDVDSGRELRTLAGHNLSTHSVTFSPDARKIASSGMDKTIRLWDVATGEELKVLRGHTSFVTSVRFSNDGKMLVSRQEHSSPVGVFRIWDVESGNVLRILNWDDPLAKFEIEAVLPDYFQEFEGKSTVNGKFKFTGGKNGSINITDSETNELLASLVIFNSADWVVYTTDGRFDTNKSLDNIEGLHWIVNNEILKPLPLDILMRQYYEPNLLRRILRCSEENSCKQEFKPLPSISQINRIQPKVAIKKIKPVADSSDLVEVTAEVENVSDEVDVSETGNIERKRLFSGAYDLRLFRDQQLVEVSSPKEKLEKFIADAPRLVAETRASGKFIDTPEDKGWREANDIFTVASQNVKRISATKIEYVFRNVKLPKDGRKEVEFTAYAFNSDRVKSATTKPVKFEIPKSVYETPKKGRAVVVSIGINASENPVYNLMYAVNDARKMQEIVGARLKNNSDKFAEIITIPLISDYGKDGKIVENTAQKAIIKGVFSLLSGNKTEVPPEVLKQIPHHENIRPIEPEDTLLITYSGHGYADRSGIFYLLPFDIGRNTTKLTPEILSKTISSDELSLWMRDITAAEMIFILDACHSSLAVQGDGFKPGPMGSRGLGQLAYDKDMKILSATQADNVALELGSLQQGLLSYALLQDGIVNLSADIDKNKILFSDEWLKYAESRVPDLYKEVKQGKRKIFINGQKVDNPKNRSEIINLNDLQNSSLNLQQPKLFDFKRRNNNEVLFNLP